VRAQLGAQGALGRADRRQIGLGRHRQVERAVAVEGQGVGAIGQRQA